MRRRCLWLGLALAAGGCCEKTEKEDCEIDGVPWNGTTVLYSCPTPFGVDYSYDCGPTTCYSVAHPDLGGCVEVDEPYPWEVPGALEGFLAGLESRCLQQCTEDVFAEADGLGRESVVDDCVGAVDEANYYLENCTPDPLGAPLEQRMEFTWSTPKGAQVAAGGAVRYALGKPGRDGTQTLRLTSLSLEPFAFATSTYDYTVLLGYPADSTVSVSEVRLRDVDVTLGPDGSGRIPAGSAVLTAVVDVSGKYLPKPVHAELTAANPFSLSVSLVRGVLTVQPVADPFGGTFTAVAAGSSSSSTPKLGGP